MQLLTVHAGTQKTLRHLRCGRIFEGCLSLGGWLDWVLQCGSWRRRSTRLRLSWFDRIAQHIDQKLSSAGCLELCRDPQKLHVVRFEIQTCTYLYQSRSAQQQRSRPIDHCRINCPICLCDAQRQRDHLSWSFCHIISKSEDALLGLELDRTMALGLGQLWQLTECIGSVQCFAVAAIHHTKSRRWN